MAVAATATATAASTVARGSPAAAAAAAPHQLASQQVPEGSVQVDNLQSERRFHVLIIHGACSQRPFVIMLVD